MLKKIIREFGLSKIIPYQKQWDEMQELPIQFFEQLGKIGMMGILVPKTYGGLGLNDIQYLTAIEEFAKLDAAIALSILAHNSLCIGHILHYASKKQQEAWLPKLASGKWIGAWALTEPEAGSDVRNIETIAKQIDEGWVLNGRKCFITNGQVSNLLVVIAKTKMTNEKNSMSAFVVEKDAQGIKVGNKYDKMGMRASETFEIHLEDCYVHSENLLGQVGEGFQQIMHVLEGGRMAMAALSLGISKSAFRAAIEYSKKRRQFNKPIAYFQGVSFQLAELATKIEAADALNQVAAAAAAAPKMCDKKAHKLTSMAKLFSSELAVEATNVTMQIMGGCGYMKSALVEKYYRDAKLCTIGEGTSEIQKYIIAKSLLVENTL